MGFLASGEPYDVYRLPSYCEDFHFRSPQLPKGSVGRCYTQSLGLSFFRWRFSLSVQTVSLTPLEVSTNQVLGALIPDIVTETRNGFDCMEPQNQNAKVFLDMCGLLGEHPASSLVLDITKQMAGAPCTHCSFRSKTSEEGQDYA